MNLESSATATQFIGLLCIFKVKTLLFDLKSQSLTFVSETIKIEPLIKKISSFGCEVKNINGHNILQLKKQYPKQLVR